MKPKLLALATPGVAGLQPYQPGRNFEEIARKYGLSEVVPLASNENPLGPGTKARRALAQIDDPGRYPDGNGRRLKRALADRHGVTPEQITLGNGSNEVIDIVVRAVVSPSHQVIYSAHAFVAIALATRAVGAEAVVVPASNFGCDVSATIDAVTERTRVVFLANPNNPTGTWVPGGELRRLLEALPEHVVAIVDEAYTEYAEDPEYPDCLDWLDRFPRLVVTRTFSKIHGLAGLRAGYAISHPELADLMNRVRLPFNVNRIALTAAEAALEDEEHVRLSIALNRAGLKQLRAGLASLGLQALPTLGNFLCVHLDQPAQPVFDRMLQKGVIVRPIGGYGMPRHLRITVGRERENRRCLEVLAEALEETAGRDRAP